MRSLEVRRHSFTKKGEARGRGSHLSHAGVRAARTVGESMGGFDYVAASTSPRTLETAISMGFAVDDVIDMPSPVETGEIDFHAWRQWDDPFTTLRTKARASDAVRAYAQAQTERVLGALDRLPDGGTALFVGHGGWIETVISQLVEPAELPRLGSSFWHLDAIRLSVSDTSSAVVGVDRHPR